MMKIVINMPLIQCHNVNSRKHFSVNAELEGVGTVQEIVSGIFKTSDKPYKEGQ